MQTIVKPLHAPSSSTTLPPASGAGRLDLRFLDGLRALAAILVICHHSWMSVWPSGEGAPAWTALAAFSHVVPVFIVLSGFCLMLPVVRGNGTLRGGMAAFLKKRAFRILPPYYLAIVFALVCDFCWIGSKTGGPWDMTLPVTWKSLCVHLLLLQNFSRHETYTINCVFWSLSLEWWIYFLFPGLAWAWKRFGPGKTMILSMAFSYALCKACMHEFHTEFTLHYLALFAFGMFACELSYSQCSAVRVFRERCCWGLFAWVAAAAVVLATTGKVHRFSSTELIDCLVGLLIVCLLVILSTRQDSFLRCSLSQKPLVFCGTFAYSIYLVHEPLIVIVWQYVLDPLHLAQSVAFLVLLLAGIPLFVACSYLFHIVCERPFIATSAFKTAAKQEKTALVLATRGTSVFWPLLRKV